MEKLAINGGPGAVTLEQTEATAWPNVSDEELEAIRCVLRQPNYAFYEEGYRLEEEFAACVGSKYALAHINGTAAIHAALFAIGIDPGDEVIVPSYTYWATCMPVVAWNALPVFADIEERSLNIDPGDIEKRITKKTKAIIVVHLFGLPCDMDRIMEIAARHGLKVVEDAAHAHGAEYRGKKLGSIGDIGCFSFQASKILPGIEGGMLVTDNREYLERAMVLGHYERLSNLPEDSSYRRYADTGLGFKYRIHPAAAAMVRVRLAKLDKLNKIRNRNMRYLDEHFADIDGFEPTSGPSGCKRSYYGYRLLYQPEAFDSMSMDRVVAALKAEGVRVGGAGYPPQHLQPVYSETRHRVSILLQHDTGCVETKLPVTERVRKRLIGLPVFPQGTLELMKQYVKAFKKVSGRWQEIPEVKEGEQTQADRSRRLIR